MRDVRRGEVDVVIAYKLDRVSRSLRDFHEFWGVIQQAGATFVSAPQSFDTSAPAGNLMLSIVLAFAQFEREREPYLLKLPAKDDGEPLTLELDLPEEAELTPVDKLHLLTLWHDRGAVLHGRL